MIRLTSSFGGATTLHVLSNPPPTSMPKLPITKALLLDPWLAPLPQKDDPNLRKELPPALCVNSEGFTLWKDHFERLRSIMAHWGSTSSSHSKPEGGAWFTTVRESFDPIYRPPFVRARPR